MPDTTKRRRCSESAAAARRPHHAPRGLASLFLREALDWAISLAIGALLAVFCTADQKAPLPRWRVILALALPLLGAALLIACFISALPR